MPAAPQINRHYWQHACCELQTYNPWASCRAWRHFTWRQRLCQGWQACPPACATCRSPASPTPPGVVHLGQRRQRLCVLACGLLHAVALAPCPAQPAICWHCCASNAAACCPLHPLQGIAAEGSAAGQPGLPLPSATSLRGAGTCSGAMQEHPHHWARDQAAAACEAGAAAWQQAARESILQTCIFGGG